ncbi:MAG: hypothetical protein KDJ39_13755 [Gammaproteobacteria bacterium]|nr:hypothetical protein [Gammaproteobacteria bacterium]MCP5299173.1 hypothetical protein [Chromatiaceae bacterium]
MPNGTSTTNSALVGGLAGGAVSAIVLLLIWLARTDPTIDNDYICFCDASTGGDSSKAVAYPVDGQPGRCPHRNRKNNFGCNL